MMHSPYPSSFHAPHDRPNGSPVLSEVVQRIQQAAMTTPPFVEQQQIVREQMGIVLQACVQTVVRPLPGQDMQDICGQELVKRAMEVAAAGGHHLLLSGPPGGGKTFLARTLSTLLPQSPLAYPVRLLHPFMPLSTVREELALAHGGVLLLENLTTYALEVLHLICQVIETRTLTDTGEHASVILPATFLLVATMQPCPCGFYGDTLRACCCSVEAIVQHQQRVIPLLEQCFDLHVQVPRQRADVLQHPIAESSARVRHRVEAARHQQRLRYAESAHLWVNADLQEADDAAHWDAMEQTAEKLLHVAHEQLHFTAHQHRRVQKLARTIADLAGTERIEANHVAEAVQYRLRQR